MEDPLQAGGSIAARPGRAHGDVPGVQYLRGYAALSVVLFHLSLQWLSLGTTPPFVTLRSGVDVFFAISGFVMVYSTDSGARMSGWEFMKRRIARVVPLYWAATGFTILVLLVVPKLVKTTGFSPFHALASFLFLPAINPAEHGYFPVVLLGWTLNYEFFFYVAFAVAIAVGRRRPARVMASIIVLFAALVLIGLAASPKGVAQFYTSPLLLEFLFGMVVALVWRRTPAIPGPLLSILGAIAIAALIFLPDESDAIRVVRFGIPAAVLLFVVVKARLPLSPTLHRLGDISYSLYLSHFFVLSAYSQLWKRLGIHASVPSYIAFMVLGLAIAVGCGWLCWRLCERPLTDATKRWLTPRAGDASQIGARVRATQAL